MKIQASSHSLGSLSEVVVVQVGVAHRTALHRHVVAFLREGFGTVFARVPVLDYLLDVVPSIPRQYTPVRLQSPFTLGSLALLQYHGRAKVLRVGFRSGPLEACRIARIGVQRVFELEVASSSLYSFPPRRFGILPRYRLNPQFNVLHGQIY